MNSLHPPEWDLLLSAAQKNRADLIQEMIEIGGVPASHANGVGQSALHIASLWGHVESVQALTDGGANVNAQNNMTGATPLHMVAQSRKGTTENRLAVIDILIAAGANVAQADNYGSLPVHALQVSNRPASNESEMDEQTRQFVAKLQPQRPEIQDAIVERDVAKVKELLAKDSSAANNKLAVVGMTPVEYTIEAILDESNCGNQGLVQILDELLSSGGDPNGENKDEESAKNAAILGDGEIKEPPLHQVVVAIRSLDHDTDIAADREEFLGNVVDMLVKGGATVTPETTQLLHQAARRNDVTFARFLIERLQIDPNSKGRQGMTPLHFAARSGQLKMVHFLLKQPGIEVYATDDRGKTPLDAAEVNQKDEVVEVLKQS